MSRVLIFGDSITEGRWDSGGGWVDRLKRHYYAKRIKDIKSEGHPLIYNHGVSADTSKELASRLYCEASARIRKDELPLILVQIGINDSRESSGKSVMSINEYESNLEKIISLSNEVASRLIFVGLSACDEAETRPVFWGDDHYTNERIKFFEKTMEKVAKRSNLAFIPVFDEFKKQMDAGKDLLIDGLHPNSKGHEVLLDIVRPAFEELLS